MENHIPDINTTEIKHILDSHTPRPEGKFKYSSVVLPIFVTENGPELLFSKRSMDLKRQPGDICFPGGKREQHESAVETAIREAHEEIGIDVSNIKILGCLDYIVTAYKAIISPFVALIENTDISELKINSDEVAEVFTVPLSFFLENEPEVHNINIKFDIPDDFPFEHIVGGRSYGWSHGKQSELFYFYKDKVIWGLTARMINNLCYLINTNKE